MQKNLSTEQKNKIYLYSASGLIFALLLILTLLGLSAAKKQSRDIIRLSDLSRLQADLLLFYKAKNIYPERILEKAEAKDPGDCARNLCIDSYPRDPKSSVPYPYFSCRNADATDCAEGIKDAKGFVIDYRLEMGAGLYKKGAYQVRPESLLKR